MNHQVLTLTLTWFLLFNGIQAQIQTSRRLGTSLSRWTPDSFDSPGPSGPPYSCSKLFCLDSPKCLVRPGSLMPCISYTLPRTYASCDCQFEIVWPGK